MKLKLNPEYAHRHLFVTLLMFGLGCWFGYDGFVRYPATPAAELYRSIEQADAPTGFDLEGFKRQKTQTQYGFTLLSFLASAVVGLRLLKASRLDVDFDDEGFTARGRQTRWADVRRIDRRQWQSKGIVKVDGLVLDAWHHLGVREFAAHLPADPA